VITHGEPHPGNLLMGASGAMFLVDWDTVRLAPPERDLWWLLEAGPADWAAYRAEGGTSTVDEDAAAFYRERWALTDLALSVAALRRARERTADGEVSWRALVGSVTT
jgi:spectinomycin phosphotransferase